jgi:hypothetical protein
MFLNVGEPMYIPPRFSCFSDTFLAMKMFDQCVAISVTHGPDIIG